MQFSLFGVGSYIDQHLMRDSFGVVMQQMETEDDGFVLHELKARHQEGQGALQTVIDGGRLVRLEELSTIRSRLW